MDFWQSVESQAWKQSSLKVVDFYLAKPGSVFLDIGAWIGPLTLYAAHAASAVYAIEADPTAFSALNANVRLNPLLESRTRIFFECTLAQSADKVQLVGVGDGTSRVSKFVNDVGLHAGATWPVKCRSLKDLFAQESIDVGKISLVSLDVVGSELDLLTSLSALFKVRSASKPAILLNVYAPAWKDAESADHALRFAAAWGVASSFKFVYDVDAGMAPVKLDGGPAFCQKLGCLMLLSDVAWKKA